MTSTLEQTFAATLASTIATDVSQHPPSGPVLRIVLRWFTPDDPLYFTVHALGEHEAAAEEGFEWRPLDWDVSERESERTARVSANPELQRVGGELAAAYAENDDWDESVPSAAILSALSCLPAALNGADVSTHPLLAVSAAHFEGWGALHALQQTLGPSRLTALDAAGLLPED